MIITKHNSLGFESLKIKTFTLLICLASIVGLTSAINCGGSKSDDPAPTAAVDANCETTGATGCTRCKGGYDYDKTGICKKLPSNCLSLSKDSTSIYCSSCFSEYTLYFGICIDCRNSGCSCNGTRITCGRLTTGGRYINNGCCYTCASGSFDMCAALTTSDNFITTNEDLLICNNGYYKDAKGICQVVTSTQHCFEADTNGICNTCNIGFSLNNSNECIAN